MKNESPANVNPTVKNAATFDIYALKLKKQDRRVQIRVGIAAL